MNPTSLNNNYAIPNQLSFFEGNEKKGKFPFIKINNQYASALISIYGGQVLSFQPHAQAKDETSKGNDLLFLSDKAYYQSGKAIKGGIPICWPWFGADPEGLGRSAHGFARNSLWAVQETATTKKEETQVILSLVDTEETRSIWPYTFNLTLNITVGKTLQLELTSHNTGNKPFTITQALHTYFSVGDISQTRVSGLDGIEYIDTTTREMEIIKQQGDIIIDKEVDRIYTNTSADITLVDESLKRQTHITSSGSNSSVIWNPWKKIAEKMADLNDNDYLHFLCVETTNAASDVIEVQPGEAFCLSVEYEISQNETLI